MCRIVLADDHHITREGLRLLIERQDDLQVIGEADNGLDAIQLATTLQPDVLIVDQMMPGIRGAEVIRQVNANYPDIKIIMLTMHTNNDYVTEALVNGASAYVLKSSRGQELIQAIRSVLSGRRYLSTQFSEYAIDLYIEKITKERVDDPYETLTPREKEVFILVVEGCANKTIGEMLGISVRTVEVHRAKAMGKLQMKNKTEMIKFALERGLID